MIRRTLLLFAALLALATQAFPQTISNISPNTATAGSGPITLTINGQFLAGFSQTTVYWNSTRTNSNTTFMPGNVTNTQIVITIPANLLTAPDTAYVYVVQESVSNQVTFTVTAVPPTLTNLSPNFAVAGSPSLTLTVNGMNFPSPLPSAAVSVTWNGAALQTSYVSSGQLTAIVPNSLLTTPGTAQVSLNTQPPPAPLTFTILTPLVLTSINPNTAVAGSPAFTLTANGSGFNKNTQVTWNQSPLITSFVNAQQVTASIPANLVANVGTAAVAVTDGQQTSATRPFAIVTPLTLTSLSPPSALSGGPAFTLVVNGTGFDASTTIFWNGSTALQPVSASANQISVTVPTALIVQAGTASITAKNAIQTSNALTFTIGPPPLTLTSLSPTTAVAGGPSFTLVVNGSGFDSSTTIFWNGSTALQPVSASANQISVTVPTALIAQAGTSSITAKNATQTSNALTFTVNLPPLTLTSISPNTTNAGGPGFTLAVNGSGFSSATQVTWNGSALTTTFGNATQLTAQVPAALIATAGIASVGVSSSGQSSPTPLSFTITPPPLTLTSMSPNTAVAGGPAFTLIVNGGGFTANTAVTWNGTALSTVFVTAAQLTASVPANLIANPGTASVGVSAPSLTSPVPLSFVIGQNITLTSLSPSSIAPGGPSFLLTLNGTGFTTGTVVLWNGLALNATVSNSNVMTATVPAALIALAGTATITAQNGNAVSNALTFTIGGQSLTLTSLSPGSAPAGSAALTLTVNGTGFLPPSTTSTVLLPGTTVTWNGSTLVTQFVSANQLTATVPATLLQNPGTAAVSVTGQPQPPSLTFTITGPLSLTSISPSTLPAGGPAFTLTVNGTGFASGTLVTWNGSTLATTFVSANQLTAAVPASLIASSGTAAISVSATGQQPPAALQFIIGQGLFLTSLSPPSATSGGPAFTLTVNGGGFTSGTIVNWNSTALATTYLSATQLTAAVTANLIAQPGTASITAVNANQISNTLTFTIASSAPTITSLSPATAVAGGTAFSLTITGTGFLQTSTVSWNTTTLQATYVSATQLMAAVTADLITQAGSALVVVHNGNLQSNPASFAITAPPPVITSLTPSSVTAGGPTFTLTVTGTGFVSGAVVSFNSTALTTTFVTTTQVTAGVPAGLIAQPGSAQVTLSNPGGAVSNAVTLTITAPPPTITSITPSTATSGGPAFSLTVNGTGFFSGATVMWNSTKLNTSFISATQLSAAVTSDLIAQPGTVQITATNNGSLASNAVTFTIAAPTPTITSISPSTVTAGGPTFTLNVTGTNFQQGATVSFNIPVPTGFRPAGTATLRIKNARHEGPRALTALTTTFVSDTQLTAEVPANLIAQFAVAQITAANPGGAASNAVSLTIANPTPTITSISPSTVPFGGPAFTLTVNGSNFVQGAMITVVATMLPTTFVSSTQLTTVVPANFFPSPGQVLVDVTNPGTMPSNPLNLTVASPPPIISGISPATIQAGGPAFTLTVSGNGFLTGATIFFNNNPLITTVVSPTQATAQVTADLIAQPGPAQITASNPGSPQSIAATLTIAPAPPTLTSISPISAKVGDPTFTLALTGTGFVQASIAQWNGSPLSTTFISSTQLTATIDAGRLILPATASVTVVNPGPNGTSMVSNALTFTINPVTPIISSISPNSATAGDPALSLTVNGVGFLTLTTIQWNTTMLTTHFVSAGQVTADVPATLLAQAGTATVVAVNPGNNLSGAVTFTINPKAPPVITSLSKTSATAGDAAFTLTVNGTGFSAGAQVNFGTTALATTFVSATQLTAAVTANLLAAPATFQVVVQQAGTSSNAISFVVNLPPPPSLRLNPPPNPGPAQQPTLDFGLNSGYPISMTGTVTLTFVSNATVPSDDPAIQFATGGRTMTFTVPPNSTTLPPLQIATGTVAGTITVTVTLTAAGVNVTPAGSTTTIPVAKVAPVIVPGKVTLVRANGYLEVDITGFSTTRDMTQAVFHLNAATGGSFTSSTITVPVSSMFTTWYQSAASTAFGSQFTYAQPFSVIGDTNQIQSVTVTLTNSAGSSVSVTSN